VYTACSTSLVAVHVASEALRNGECDMALAGGVCVELPIGRGRLYEEGGVDSADGHVRPFDSAASGTMWSSGGGVVVLKRLSDALADGDSVRAVVLGSAINNDGSRKAGFTAPSVQGQAAAVASALAVAGVDPRSVTYVEAHGTATRVGDPIEVAALSSVYGRDAEDNGWCGIGSVKGNIGHLSHGAGVVGLIKTTLAMRHGLLPPSINYTEANPAIDFAATPFYVNCALSKWDSGDVPRRAGISSFGVGGTNAHLILEEAPVDRPALRAGPRPEPAGRPGVTLLRLSARTPNALAAACERLAGHLDRNPDADLRDVAFTLRVGRTPRAHRAAVVCTDVRDAVAALADPGRRLTGLTPASPPRVALLFSGQGSQYAGMGAGLYRHEPVFAAAVDECADALAGDLDVDLRRLLADRGPDADAMLARTEYAQPALFAVGYALARLWQSWGVRPSAMLGHSVGEYAAATVAGVFDPADAARLVALRGRLMQSMPPGAMLAVARPAEEVAGLLPAGVTIAAVNGPGTCVVSGPFGPVDELAARLADRDVATSRLRTSHAFHSAMMDPILDEFRAAVAAVPRQSPRTPFVSNRTGEMITAAQATDPAYWAGHLREPVRFADGVARVLADGPAVFVECGPGRQLTSLVTAAARDGAPAVHSLPDPANRDHDLAAVATAAGRLWAAGVPLDGFGARGRRVVLPTYPYERSYHWVDPDPPATAAVDRRQPTGRLPLDRWFSVPAWRQLPPLVDRSPGGRWVVFGGPATAALTGSMVAAGDGVVEVVPGPAYRRLTPGRYELRPEEPADYLSLVADLRADDRLSRVVHAWALDGPPAGVDPAATWRAQDRGLFSLLFLIQALAATTAADGLRVDVLTWGTQNVLGGDLTRPEHATVAGIVRSVPYDVPLLLRHVDAGPADLADPTALLAELSQPGGPQGRPDDGGPLIALRGGRRWAPDYPQVPLAAPTDARAGLRECGVYLITGGLGGLGLAVAEDLATRARARLVLLGRTPMPPREEWDAHLAEHRPTERTARIIGAVRRMESAGAEVLLVAADVTDPAAMRGVRVQILGRFGALHGIIHAAGVAGGGVTETRRRADMMPILLPKITGVLALRAAFGDLDLDTVVLFSSATGVVGALGEIDYCAANAFLDAHAQSDHGWRAPVRSFGWAGWRDVGMLAGPAADETTAAPAANETTAAPAANETTAAPAANETTAVPSAGHNGHRDNGHNGRAAGGATVNGHAAPAVVLDHPLLSTLRRHPDGTAVCAGTLNPARHWVLADHRIDGLPVLPATAQLDLMHHAASAAVPPPGPGHALELTDVLFTEPLVVPDGLAIEFQVRLRPADDRWFATVSASVGGVERVFGRGRLRWVLPPAADGLDLADVRGRCAARPDLAELTHQLPGGVVAFGPYWRNVREVWLGETEQLTRLVAPGPAESDLDRWMLQPAMADQATFKLNEPIRGYLPMGYGRVLLREPLPAEVWVHRRFPAAGAVDEDSDEVRTDDFRILDGAGRELMAATDFMLRLVDTATIAATMRATAAGYASGGPPARNGAPATPANGTPARNGAAATIVNPAGRTASPIGDGSALWMAPADGVAAFHRALAAPLGAHVLITPTPLTDIGAYVRSRTAGAERAGAAGPAGPTGPPDPPEPGSDRHTSTEATLAGMWRAVLGVTDVGVDDSFFERGGNSLVAVQLFAQLRRALGIRLPMRDLLAAPTLRSMANRVDELLAAARSGSSQPGPARSVVGPGAEPARTTIPLLPRRRAEP
jgi:acyl transferase domain-containing protein/acyl carrier protein